MTAQIPGVIVERPAESYAPAPDLWLVTTYFNPSGYRSRLHNYQLFRERIHRSRLKLLTIECTFGDQPASLAPAPDVITVQGRDPLWQKERLLNVAIGKLPPECSKLAWLDGDVWFTNPAWALDTARLLDRYEFVQPFDTTIRLVPNAHEDSGRGYRAPGFASVYAASPELAASKHLTHHGETGFAWAARREVVARHGLYDVCIAGGADHLIAHAMCGNWSSPCLDLMLGASSPRREHFLDWAHGFYRDVGGRIGYVPGTILHLWHGSADDRLYVERHREMERLAFDPRTDLRLSSRGCWEWASDKPELQRWVAAYFGERREDD